MSEENKKRLKEYQKTIVRQENRFYNDKMYFKIAIAKIFFVCFFIFFKRKNGVLIIIIIKAFNVWPHLALHKVFIILLLLKYHLIFEKLITRFIIIKINYQSHYQINYQIHYHSHYHSSSIVIGCFSTLFFLESPKK